MWKHFKTVYTRQVEKACSIQNNKTRISLKSTWTRYESVLKTKKQQQVAANKSGLKADGMA